jgi:MoaA/NifB/PqqE/SkfB family radical SAM enzyme
VPRLVIELTNRCNLRCGHCFQERHAATGELSAAVLEKLVREGKDCGIEQVSFTGGEPTLHRRFRAIVDAFAAAGYRFSFVTNGATFPRLYPFLSKHREHFAGVTFSLDGAREATHDALRGAGSYRQVLRAASICVARTLPFTFNMVLTRENRHEIAEMVSLADALGSDAVRFGHLMPTPDTTVRGIELTPGERRTVEADIWELRRTARIPVGMAPGYFSEDPLFACGPLALDEYNVDYSGNMTLCCQLSGNSGPNGPEDMIADLNVDSLREACERFRVRVAAYLDDKRERIRTKALTEIEHFPCWYCLNYLGKTRWLNQFPSHAWNGSRP